MSYLIHHGIKGQKWGIRRYQNPDGTLTEAGKKRYYDFSEASRKYSKAAWDYQNPNWAKNKKKAQDNIDRARKRMKEVEENIDVDKYRDSILGSDTSKKYADARKSLDRAHEELSSDEQKRRKAAEKLLQDRIEMDKKSKYADLRYYSSMTKDEGKKWVDSMVDDFFGSIDAHDDLFYTYVESSPEYKKAQDFVYDVDISLDDVPYGYLIRGW